MSTEIEELGPEITEAVRMLNKVSDCDRAMERTLDTLMLLWSQAPDEGESADIARRNAAGRCYMDLKEIEKAMNAASECLRKIGVAIGHYPAIGKDAA